jgi:hypothetical protein
MKTKNDPCKWRDTATKPKSVDWSYDSTKAKRKYHSKRKPIVSATKRKLPAINPDVTITKSNFTLASLGLSFAPSYG